MMKKTILALGLLGVMSIPLTASASLLEGVLDFTGAANISFGSVAFVDNAFQVNFPAAGDAGGFAPLAGTTGGIMNITDPPDAVGALDIPDFITFTAAPNISITLTYLYPGIDGAAGCTDSPPAAGQECTPDFPAQSPVNLQNTSATTSTASIEVLGLEVDSLTDTSIPIVGTFSTPFSSLNFQQILAIIGDGSSPGGTVSTSFSAQFSTTVPGPEPGTLVQLMIAAVGVGGFLVYRKRVAQA